MVLSDDTNMGYDNGILQISFCMSSKEKYPLLTQLEWIFLSVRRCGTNYYICSIKIDLTITASH